MTRMIVTDLDETLLRSDKSISVHTIAILKKCRDAGIKMVYATARGGSAERITPAGIFDGKISRGGAIAKTGDKIIYSRLIPYQIARPILIACDKRELKTTLETADIKRTNYGDNAVDFSQHDIDAEMISFVGLTSDDQAFVRSLLPENLYFMAMSDIGGSYGGYYGMIMHKDATKLKAVSELARLWGIAMSEITAFGDDVNDLEMLANCGTGIAVENAIDEAKAAAGHICGANDEDGVARWLEENVL